MVESAARTVRERARAELTRQIIDTAREHLITDGAAGLSLRAVARDLGMASSAVYRYMPSRDDLLTALIVEAYRGVGDAVTAAEAAVAREDFLGRWLALGHAVRDWAKDHPHEYALIYGSPVPGYRAPTDTVGPASMVAVVAATIVFDALAAGALAPDTLDPTSTPGVPADDPAGQALQPLLDGLPPGIPRELLVRWLMAITFVYGAVSFELFGQHHNVVTDDQELARAHFEGGLRRIAVLMGLPATG